MAVCEEVHATEFLPFPQKWKRVCKADFHPWTQRSGAKGWAMAK